MGRDLAKMMFLVLTPILLLHLVISPSSGEEVKPNEKGICISKGGERFFPYKSNACFSSNATNQVLVSCGGSNKASKWESNGTVSKGLFTVQTEPSEKPAIETESSEKPVIETESSENPVVETESSEKTENFAWFRDLEKTYREMDFVQKISWPVTAIVGGIMLLNWWRKNAGETRYGSNMNGNA